jgi:hypothetical protein
MELTELHTRSKPVLSAQKDSGSFFSCASNSSSVKPFFQAKLTINMPGDSYEKEADSVADAVVNGQYPVQRKCDACEKDEKDKVQNKPIRDDITHVQRAGNRVSGIDEQTELAINQSRGSGNALSTETQSAMEDSFGADFSTVRIHNDARAAQLNQSINARAFTTGTDIFFNNGEFSPGTHAGRHLLAHELTHVVQQGNSKSQVQKTDKPSDWCFPVLELLDFETKYGKIGVLLRYSSFTTGIIMEDKLIPLNHNIPSTLGDVDVDWMFRLACTQYLFYITGNVFPSLSEYLAAKSSRRGLFILKGIWNTIRAPFPEWTWEYESIYETGNWNAAPAVTEWLFGTGTLGDLFSPAVNQCMAQ